MITNPLAVAPGKHIEYVPGQLVLRVRGDAVTFGTGRGAAADALPGVAKPLDYLRTNAGLKAVEPLIL